MIKLARLKPTYAQCKNAVIQLLIFALLFNLLHFYQSSHLLDNDEVIATKVLALPQLNGQWFNPQQLAGKTTVVYFFAPWCRVCHLSIGNLENLYQAKQGQINVVAVALDHQSHQQVAEFVRDKQLTFAVLLGNAQVMETFKINGFPTYYVLDGEGRVTGRTQGYSTELGLRLRAM